MTKLLLFFIFAFALNVRAEMGPDAGTNPDDTVTQTMGVDDDKQAYVFGSPSDCKCPNCCNRPGTTFTRVEPAHGALTLGSQTSGTEDTRE